MTDIAFAELPSTWLVPGIFVELDESQLGTTTDQTGPTLLIVQKLAAGTVAVATPTRVRTTSEGVTYCGEGSIGAQMIEKYIGNDLGGGRDVRIIALSDAPGSIAATGKIGLVGPATASGEIAWWIGGRRVTSAVVSGEAASATLTTAAAAITAADNLPATVATGTSAVTLKMKHNAAPAVPGKALYVEAPAAGAWPNNIATLNCDNTGGSADTTVALSDATTIAVADNNATPTGTAVYYNHTDKLLCSVTSCGYDLFVQTSTGYLIRVKHVASTAGLIQVYFDDDAAPATDKVLFVDPGAADDTAPLVTDYLVFTARHGGTCGNRIDLRHSHNYGEGLPAGLSAAVVTMSGGATDPDIGDAIAVMGSQAYDVVCHPWGHTSTQDVELDDELVTRWGATVGLYGHEIAASVDTVANLSSLAASTGMNTPRASVAGAYCVPSPPWECAAALAGKVAQYMRAEPAPQPIEGLALTGITPPAVEHGLTGGAAGEQQTLLADGILPLALESGALRICRFVSLQITDGAGIATDAGRDALHRFDYMRIARRLRSGLYNAFARKRVTTDEQTTAPNTVTLGDIKREVVSLAREMRDDGMIENLDAFLANLTVAKGSATRVDILFPPDMANPLVQLAVLHQPRLDYDQATA